MRKSGLAWLCFVLIFATSNGVVLRFARNDPPPDFPDDKTVPSTNAVGISPTHLLTLPSVNGTTRTFLARAVDVIETTKNSDGTSSKVVKLAKRPMAPIFPKKKVILVRKPVKQISTVHPGANQAGKKTIRITVVKKDGGLAKPESNMAKTPLIRVTFKRKPQAQNVVSKEAMVQAAVILKRMIEQRLREATLSGKMPADSATDNAETYPREPEPVAAPEQPIKLANVNFGDFNDFDNDDADVLQNGADGEQAPIDA